MNVLETLRKKIDKIDSKLSALLSQRADLSRKIGIYKKINNLPIVSKSREQQVIRNAMENAQADEEFVKEVFIKILEESKKVQK